MDNLTVVSKVKRYIKEKSGFSTSSSFFEKLNEDLSQECSKAISAAQEKGRKTVMGRDFSFYSEAQAPEEQLVVASKVKQLVKDKAGLSTSSQVFPQLTLRVRRLCDLAIENTTRDKRKTVLDRDYHSPESMPA